MTRPPPLVCDSGLPGIREQLCQGPALPTHPRPSGMALPPSAITSALHRPPKELVPQGREPPPAHRLQPFCAHQSPKAPAPGRLYLPRLCSRRFSLLCLCSQKPWHHASWTVAHGACGRCSSGRLVEKGEP